MKREMVEIEPCEDGWLVRSGQAMAAFPTKLQAIERAHALASRRYADTGRPTAVRVPMPGGGAIIIGACG